MHVVPLYPRIRNQITCSSHLYYLREENSAHIYHADKAAFGTSFVYLWMHKQEILRSNESNIKNSNKDRKRFHQSNVCLL